MIKNRTKFVRLIACLLGAWLAGCGGGGGGGDSGGGNTGGGNVPSTFNLSGTISIAETAAVDTDTNDVNQTGYLPNDTAATAQEPWMHRSAGGQRQRAQHRARAATTTTARPRWVTWTTGSASTWWPARWWNWNSHRTRHPADVDLYVVSADTNTVGASEGVDTRFECVAVTQPTSYYVVVSAYSKASIYNMRIGAPGSAAKCARSRRRACRSSRAS
jgi:hypothetical protein